MFSASPRRAQKLLKAYGTIGLKTALLLALSLLALPAVAQTAVSIHDVMQSLPGGPYLGKSVTVSGGVVVGVFNPASSGSHDFYLSEPSSGWDSLRATAEGMPIFASNGATGCTGITDGDILTVTGVVVNSSATTAANTPGTGIQPTSCSKTGTGSMTQSIDLANFGALQSFGDALFYTGMAATDRSFVAIAPTGGSVSGSAVVSNGQFWAVLSSGITTNNHMFRQAGIAKDEYVPSGAPSTVPTWSGNPQRILIDTVTFGGSAVDITVGQTITCTNNNTAQLGATAGIGLIDYTLGYARLLIFKETTCSVSGTVATSVSAAADSTHFKVGTLDVNAFLGSASIFSLALQKATLAVTGVFGSPDIFAMQEVGNQTTLQVLADAANTANSGSTAYTATVLGTDLINNGFLINSNTVKNVSCTEQGRNATYTTAAGGSATLWDHPPLVCTGEFVRVGKNYPVTVIDVNLLPRDNIGDGALGPDIRTRRAAQAAALSALVQSYQSGGANVIVAGNFNAYEYNDGYVDVLGVIDGSPAAAGAVTLYQATSTSAALHDFTTDVTANTRYNIIERGNAAALEHILASNTVTDASTASASLASYVNVVTQPHFSTDYAAVDANDNSTPAGLTPHDGFLVNFAIPPVPTTASVSPTALDFGNVVVGGSASKSVTVTNTTTFTSTVNVTNIAISGANATDYTQTSSCLALSQGSTCTVTVTFAPTATGTRTATLTITTDSTSNGALTVSLTGNGIASTATLTPASASYGTVVLGSTSAAQTFTWTNTSPVPLNVSTVNVTGDYAISATTCNGQVAANSSCTIAVVFKPTALKTRTGTLTVTSNASANGTLTASLTGIGVADVQADVDSLSFGNVDVGYSSSPVTFTVTNYTGAAIALTGFSITGDYRYTTTCGSTINGNTSCSVTVVFTPTTTGTRTGAFVITTNDNKYPVITVALTGNGVDFSLALNPTSGNVIAGYDVAKTTLTATALGGFNAPITLTCSTPASGAVCAMALSTFTLSATTTDAITITTTSEYTVPGYTAGLLGAGTHSRWLMLLGLCAGAALFAARRRATTALRLLLALAALALTAGGLSGCSGRLPDTNSPYTSPGTYTVTLSGTDGTLTHTVSYSLTVTAK